MKKIISKYKGCIAFIFLLSLVVIATIFPLQKVCSQNIDFPEPRPCGGYKIDTTALRAAINFESVKANSILSTSFLIRVYFHILTDDNGTNAAATQIQIKDEFDTLVAAYTANNICFLNGGVNTINSSYLNTGFNADTDPSSVFDPYRIPNCINIFYLRKINGSNPACGTGCTIGGTSLKIPNTFCLISKGNVGKGQTIAHEVGHCMGLLHTFEPYYGFENIDGTNSDDAGDLIKDTPADPYAYKNMSCFSFSSISCTYTGSCTDPKGQSNFSPPYRNLMGYWWGACFAALTLTGDQYTRANSYLSSNSDLQSCESVPNLSVGPVTYTSDYHMFSAINTLITNGSVDLGGSSVTTLGGNLVSIQPGFVASSSGGALILVRSSACSSPVSRSISETNSKLITKINNNTTTNDLKIYPNPFSQQFMIEFDLEKATQASIDIYDLAGRQLKSISKSFLKEGTHQFTTDASDLPAGVYIVVLQAEKFRTAQKIVKVN